MSGFSSESPQYIEALEKLGIPVEANMFDLLNRAILADGDADRFVRSLSSWSVVRRAMLAAESYRKAMSTGQAEHSIEVIQQEQSCLSLEN